MCLCCILVKCYRDQIHNNRNVEQYMVSPLTQSPWHKQIRFLIGMKLSKLTISVQCPLWSGILWPLFLLQWSITPTVAIKKAWCLGSEYTGSYLPLYYIVFFWYIIVPVAKIGFHITMTIDMTCEIMLLRVNKTPILELCFNLVTFHMAYCIADVHPKVEHMEHCRCASRLNIWSIADVLPDWTYGAL